MKTSRLSVVITVALLSLPVAAAAQGQQPPLNRREADWPKDPRALKLVERQIEAGSFGPVEGALPGTPRYLVTYMRSDASSTIRTATVVTVTNQSATRCDVTVSYFDGFSNNSSPICTVTLGIPPDWTVDFCSRVISASISGCNQTCSPALTFSEGRAIVSSTCREIGVSSRVYYTGAGDATVSAISDSKVVVFGAGNSGD